MNDSVFEAVETSSRVLRLDFSSIEFAKLAEEQDVKRLLAIYYQQDLTTEVFHAFDGEEYVHG